MLAPDRFSEFVSLTPSELAAMDAWAGSPAAFKRRSVIRPEGDEVRHLFILISGWVASSTTLRDGTRQFFKIHVPGDVLGAPSLASTTAVESLIAISDCQIRRIYIDRLGEVFEHHPRLGASLYLSANKERVALMDNLVSIGNLSAKQRLCRLLVDLYDRLAARGQVDESVLPMLMTQEEIGDYLGLTAVHVNRTVRELEQEGLITRQGSDLTIDAANLRSVAQLQMREYVHEPAWLPNPR